ncbi:HEPN domain-containing protein [Thermofilum sp.]|uniref:HEPN domain-containing protein n=1 Tax=Thermofilum sp. TaxID=1961369 RepID=UPI0031670466
MSGSEDLKYAENLVEKARGFVSRARDELKSYNPSYSNAVALCQNAIELCGKAIYKLMGMEFPREHQLLFEREGKVAQQFKELLSKEFPRFFSYRDEIPRVVFLSYFWHRFGVIARYGIEEAGIPPDKLFTEKEAKLAVEHAEECLRVAQSLLGLKRIEKK